MDDRLAMSQDPEDDRKECSGQPPDPWLVLRNVSLQGSELVVDGLDELFIADDLPDDEIQEGVPLQLVGRGPGVDGRSVSSSAEEDLEARDCSFSIGRWCIILWLNELRDIF